MQYRQLGTTGARLSVIGLGSYLTIGMSIDKETAAATVRKAHELGINFIDTANAYNEGKAEESLGAILEDFPRSSIFLATKVWAPMGTGPNDKGLSAKHIYEQCHASLRRLRTDYIDLYQCHRPDLSTPLEETVRTMEDLARAGKILYWGTSEWPPWMIEMARGIARAIGARPPVSNQPRYSALYRQPEAELFPYCRASGIGNVVFSPLAHGMLTGKYAPGKEPPAGTRAADPKQNAVMMNLYWNEEMLQKSVDFAALAREAGFAPAQLALAWIHRRSEVVSTIIGVTKVEQLEDNVKASEMTVSEDLLAKVDKILPGPGEPYPL